MAEAAEELSGQWKGFVSMDALVELEESLDSLSDSVKYGELKSAQLRFKLDGVDVEFVRIAQHWWVKVHHQEWFEENVDYGK